MISNAVANTPASSGPVRSGHAGRASGETENAFRDALDKSARTESEPSEKNADVAETGPRNIIADVRWHSLEKAPGEPGSDAGTPADASGEKRPEEAGKKTPDSGPDIAGKPPVPQVAASQPAAGNPEPGAENAVRAETAPRRAAATAGVVAKASAPDLAEAPAGNGDVAVKEPRQSARNVTTSDRQAAAEEQASGMQEKAGGVVAGTRTANDRLAGQDRTKRSDPAAARISDGRQAVSPATADTSPPEPANGRAAGTRRDGQDRTASSAFRVTGDANSGVARTGGDAPRSAALPATEPAAAVKVSVAGDVLPGPSDAPVSRQVADAVVRDLEDLAPSRLSLSGNTTPGARTVKTMRLQLNPAELGTVNIRMHSVDGELRVTIQADSDRTSRMLHNDTDAIRHALRAAGISGADVVVAAHRNDPAQPQGFAAQHRDPSGQQMGAQENRQNASNESRQSYRETSSNDSASSQAGGGDAGDSGIGRGSRIVI